jgi:DNA processing protein
MTVETVKESKAGSIAEFTDWKRVERELAALERRGVTLLRYTDTAYPEALRQIEDSPILLHTKGSLEPRDRCAIAVVGSRMMTDYGRMVAERLAFDLASRGFTIVSGMARGIDTVAHRAALRARGRSVAVLGAGIDRPYPSENRKLFEQICMSGCTISEFPLGTPPLRENFPKRNRLISGLSLGVVVVEATAESGSLITAHHALEQGREVFAVPGNITSASSEGTNLLLKRGAKLVQTVDDIIEEIAPLVRGYLRQTPVVITAPVKGDTAGGLAINDEEKAICDVLGTEPKQIDTIAREAQMMPSKLLSLLLDLEIKGVVRQIEGKKFYRL